MRTHERSWNIGGLILLACVSLFLLINIGRADNAETAAAIERVGGDIRFLASDELKGRGPDTDGLQKAADFLRDEFKKLGLTSGVPDGSYFQPFDIDMDIKAIAEKCRLILRGPNDKVLTLELGANYQPLATGAAGQATAPLAFAGYGISAKLPGDKQYDDFQGADVAGKIIIVIRREPQQGRDDSPFDGNKVTPHSFIRTKLEAAKKAKAAGVLFVNDSFTTNTEKKDELISVSGFGTAPVGVPLLHVTQATINDLLATTPLKAGDGKTLSDLSAVESHIDETLQPLTQPLEGWTAEFEMAFEKVKANVVNVVGVLEGEGPLADETIVIGAHYDHLGFGPFGSRKPEPRAIHPGADDNASGTAAMLELARRFAGRDHKPARRLVFIGFSAEERGIIGSNYYCANPLFPLDKTVAMFNYDMIGQMRNNELHITGITSATEFSALADKLNGDGKLALKKGPVNAMGDHFGFYQKGVPAMHFFTGITNQYHTPDDKFETILVDGVVRTIDFSERLLDAVIELPQRPTYVKANLAGPARGGMAYLGITPDYAGGTDGLKVTEVADDSPAKTGGLKPGDLIVQFGDIPVADIEGLAAGLRKYKPGDKVPVIVKRGDEKTTVTVTLGQPRGM